MSEVIIVRAVETCSACPSQWDAWDMDGNYWYLRHRHGRGQAWKYPSSDWRTWPDGPPRMSYEYDGESTEEIGDGYVSLEEFCRRTGLNLHPKANIVPR
jgi:hypothetical protein